jgi:hypothetical protein
MLPGRPMVMGLMNTGGASVRVCSTQHSRYIDDAAAFRRVLQHSGIEDAANEL